MLVIMDSPTSETKDICDIELIRSQEDPLADVSTCTEISSYYRLNETVFAEPIPNLNEGIKANLNDDGDSGEIRFVDNVVVLKRTGKRNRYHIDVDENLSQPKCPQTDCHKTFSTMTLLRAHIRKVHCAERDRYICEHCASGFPVKYLLERHMAVHNGEKVGCPVCGKMLSRRTNLSAHVRAHAGTRPHACRACPRTFARPSTLNAHVRYVHGDGPLRCSKCHQRFPSRKLLTNHKSCQQLMGCTTVDER